MVDNFIGEKRILEMKEFGWRMAVIRKSGELDCFFHLYAVYDVVKGCVCMAEMKRDVEECRIWLHNIRIFLTK